MSQETRLAVDIGGTFTDIVLESNGRRLTRKLLTTTAAPEEAVLAGISDVLAEAKLAWSAVGVLVHGTTLATNAIIERKGAKTALIATDGFRDVLEIAYESRYDQYDLYIEKPKPLVPRALRFTVPERVDVRGAVRLALDEEAVRALVPKLKADGVMSVAVALIHSYANADHERRIGAILAAAMPEIALSLSADVCPEVREYERTSTTVANAYVQPLIERYLRRLESGLAAGGFKGVIYLMTSGGGLTTLDTACRYPIRLVESGPAGGAVLAAHIAALCGEAKVLSYDMGGTTAKICLIDNYEPHASRGFEVDRAARFLKGSGLPLRIPVIEMIEVGAGGGSIARIDQLKRVTVGPESAGSAPGPACYGRNGTEPTVTDADFVLGRIDASRFAGGRMRLDEAAARGALERAVGTPLGLNTETAAFAVKEVVDENMANAARVHAVERGVALGGYSLIAFGGAAPLHACRIAEKLGLARIIVPANAGVGSAIGFLLSPIAYEVVHSRYMRLSAFDADAANVLIKAMSEEAHRIVSAGAGGAAREERRQAHMRYVGQGHEIVVSLPLRALGANDRTVLQEAFDKAYKALFQRTVPHAEVEILSWAIQVSTAISRPASLAAVVARTPATPTGQHALFDAEQGKSIAVPLYARDALKPGHALRGPALIVEDETSTFVSVGFDAYIDNARSIVLERRKS